jgi:hypothetical protein
VVGGVDEQPLTGAIKAAATGQQGDTSDDGTNDQAKNSEEMTITGQYEHAETNAKGPGYGAPGSKRGASDRRLRAVTSYIQPAKLLVELHQAVCSHPLDLYGMQEAS